jgi:hypothetical protein
MSRCESDWRRRLSAVRAAGLPDLMVAQIAGVQPSATPDPRCSIFVLTVQRASPMWTGLTPAHDCRGPKMPAQPRPRRSCTCKVEPPKRPERRNKLGGNRFPLREALRFVCGTNFRGERADRAASRPPRHVAVAVRFTHPYRFHLPTCVVRFRRAILILYLGDGRSERRTGGSGEEAGQDRTILVRTVNVRACTPHRRPDRDDAIEATSRPMRANTDLLAGKKATPKGSLH